MKVYLISNGLTKSGRIPPRRIEDSRIPPERRPRDPLDYRQEPERRGSIPDRSYARMAGEPLKPGSPSSKPIDDPNISTQAGKHKDAADTAREILNPRVRPPIAPSIDEKPDSAAYGYNRERLAQPAPTADRYRDVPEYGRAPYPPPAGRGRDPDPREPPYDRSRDPRDPYYDYPPPADYRGREPYPPRPPPLDYPRDTPYDERYPPPLRGAPLDLDAPRGREAYRDLPPRSQDYGQKRKYSPPDYIDPYEGPRVRLS
jgi:hypothetical protein